MGLFQLLGDDSLRLVTRLLAIRDRVTAGMCCQQLSRLSVERVLWEEISFTPTCAARLTDAMLACLLRRVDAVRCVRSISLKGCVMIKGSGLTPLKGSMFLEVLDLRLGHEDHIPGSITGLKAKFVGPLVTSMLKDGSHLEALMLRRQKPRTRGWDIDTWRSPWRAIMVLLRDHLEERKRRDSTRCGYCEKPLIGRQRGRPLGYPACTTCRRHSCGLGSSVDPPSCPGMIDCTHCGMTYCHECKFGGHCDICGDQFCDDCRPVCHCQLCGDQFCDECRPVTFCDECGDPFCDKCREVYFCDACGKPFCDKCREVNFCDTCELPFCEQCRDVSFCDACSKPFCDKCREVNFCDTCELPFCEQCRDVSFCDACSKPFCDKCREVYFCDSCELPFCEECRGVSFCGVCTKPFCEDCREVSFCGAC